MVVTKSNYNVKSVFYSKNAGFTWVSKDDSLHVLPNMPIRYALINPKDTKQVMDFNQKIQNDKRVENMLLPLRDGIMIVRKR